MFTPPADAVGAVPPSNTLDLRIRIEILDNEPPIQITGRRGLLYPARIVEAPSMNRDAFSKVLIGQRVAGRGRITGVESHATMYLGEGSTLGLLIEGP